MDTPLDGHQQRIAELWQARRAGRRWPSRGQFDLPDFEGAVGRVALLDVVRDGPGAEATTLRYRLWGTWITHEIGQDLTGLTIDALAHDWQRGMVRRIYDRVVGRGQPVAATRMQVGQTRSMGHCLISLPLGAQRVDMVLTVYGLLPSRPPGWRGPWAMVDSYALHQAAYDLREDGTLPDEPYARDAAFLEAQDVPPAASPVPGLSGSPRCNVPVGLGRRP